MISSFLVNDELVSIKDGIVPKIHSPDLITVCSHSFQSSMVYIVVVSNTP